MESNSSEHKKPEPRPEISASDVVELYSRLSDNGVPIWLDGGWGVDALLGEQTRKHRDLDIAIEGRHASKLKDLLATLGYQDKPRDDTRAWNYILADDSSHEIDVHVINIDEYGNGIYGPTENGEMYPASALTGEGSIGGCPVRCISAEDMVKFHSGYDLDMNDYQDVKALCDKFGIKLPDEYARFESPQR